jgi:hypothetical protein
MAGRHYPVIPANDRRITPQKNTLIRRQITMTGPERSPGSAQAQVAMACPALGKPNDLVHAAAMFREPG